MLLKKFATWVLFIVSLLLLLTPYWVSKDLLFPFITSKAFYLRILTEIAFPSYVFLLLADPKVRPNMRNPLNISVLAFLVLSFISAFVGVNTERAMWGNFERMGGAYYLLHLSLIYFYVLALGQSGGKYLQWFLKMMVYSSSALALYGWFVKWDWQWILFFNDPSMPARVSATFGNPIFYASYLLIPMFLAAFFAFQSENLQTKIWYWFLAALQLSAIFLSGTRGALVGLIVGFGIAGIIFVALNANHNIRRFGGGLLALGFMAIVLLFAFPQKLPASFSSRIFNLNDSNSKARFIQWGSAIQGLKDYPLLGTGPENYYYIANKYYNPELYKYDKSWFDKPHNYILEILVTNGILGFIPYIGMLLFSILALYKGYKSQFLSLLEFCLLLAGFLAYQVQNLFVFDTVAASFMFFASLAFWAYINEVSKEVSPKKQKYEQGMVGSFALAGAGVTAIVAVYAVWLTNIQPMHVAKAVNYGYAYSSKDLQQSKIFFDDALQAPFLFDPGEVSVKYTDFVMAEAQAATTTQSQMVAREDLNRAESLLKSVLEKQGTYSIYWQKLASVYLAQDMFDKTQRNYADEAIQKAIDLAPRRIEGRTFYAQIKAVRGNMAGAIEILKEAQVAMPNTPELSIQLAYYYDLMKDFENSKKYTEEALALNYKFRNFNDMQGLVHYYENAKDYGKVVELMEQAIKLEPNNINVYMDLLKAYTLAGKSDQAKRLGDTIVKEDPSKQQEVASILATLK